MRDGDGGNELTLILKRAGQGDRQALHELMPLVYEELRRKAGQYMSHEASGHTLQPTALVNEVFMKLLHREALPSESRRHFFNAAAEAMRQILVDHSRRKRSEKRGGALARVDLDQAEIAGIDPQTDWEAVDLALEELKGMDRRRYDVVMLRFFAGLSDAKVAESLEVSEKTVERDWRAARLFLLGRVSELDQQK